MIIQHPDGSYEVCPIPPFAARWLQALLRLRGAGRCAAAIDGAAEATSGEPCQSDNGALCRSRS